MGDSSFVSRVRNKTEPKNIQIRFQIFVSLGVFLIYLGEYFKKEFMNIWLW